MLGACEGHLGSKCTMHMYVAVDLRFVSSAFTLHQYYNMHFPQNVSIRLHEGILSNCKLGEETSPPTSINKYQKNWTM